MKRSLLKTMLLLCALIVGMSSAWAEEETITFPTSSTNVDCSSLGVSVTGTHVSVTISKGTSSYLATNTDGTRIYNGNSMVFTSTDKKISKIVFAYKRNKKQTNGVSANVGSFTNKFTVGNSQASNLSATWEASDNETASVTFTVGSGSGNYALESAEVTFVEAVAPTHTVTFSVNGTTTTATVAEGAAIEFPNNPADINGMKFVGWYTDEYTHATDAPSFVTSATMGDSDVTYYAVFAEAEATGQTVETKTQTLQYDTWTYSGTTTNMTSYRLFAENSYIESASFDLSKLSKVIVYAGTYGTLSSANKKVTVTAGETTWGSATLTTNSATTQNTITSNTSLSESGNLHIVAGGGDGDNNGIRISKVEIFTNEPVFDYSNYCTTVPSPAITLSTNLVEATADGTESTTINVTYTAIETSVGVDFVWYTDETANTAITDDDEPDWLIPEINSSNNLAFLFEENTGAARTAYMKVYALDVNGEDVYSELITITQAAATLPITVSEAGWATFAPTQNVSFDPEVMSVYVVTNATTTSATLQSVSSVPANTPVLICAEAGTYGLPVVDAATAPTTNLLQVSNGSIVGNGSTIYSLAKIDDVGFYLVGNGVTIPAGKCYLDIGTQGQGNARAFLTLGGNTETGITTVAADAADGNIYDLTGRRVSGVARGLYIVNGKKVVLK